MNFYGRDFLRILDFSEEELRYMLKIAKEFKKMKKAGINHKVFPDKNIAILSSLHNLNQALAFGNKFFFLKNGEITYQGGIDAVDEKVINDTFDINIRIAEIEKQKIIMGVN